MGVAAHSPLARTLREHHGERSLLLRVHDADERDAVLIVAADGSTDGH